MISRCNITLATVPERLADTPFWADGPTLPLAPLLWIATFVAVVVGAWQVHRRWPTWRRRLQPLICYYQFARAQGLGWGQIWLLWWMARQCRLSTPLTLMVCDATLEAHADELAGRLAAGRARRLGNRVDTLREKLFGATAGDDEA